MGQKYRPNYWKNAALLTGSDVVLRLAGLGLRIGLANALGGEGMGLYQLVLAVYGLFVTLATAGISVAATRLLTEELSRDAASARGMLRRLLALGAGLGVLAMAAQAGLAGLAAKWWLGDVRAAGALRLSALGLPWMAVSAVLRGFFLARRRVGPNVASQLAEQTVRIGAVAAALYATPGRDAGERCTLVLGATALSEAVSCTLMALFCRGEARRCFGGKRAQTPPEASRRLWDILWPVEGGRVLASALHTAENMLVPACLAVYLTGAGGRAAALEQYGVLKGMALPLLTFPFGLLGSLAVLLMPEITQAHVLGQTARLNALLDRMLRLTGFFSALAAALFWCWGPDAAGLLYGSAEAGFYLQVLAPVLPLLYLESMVDGAMKGVGEQKAAFRYSVWDAVLRLAGVAVLLPRYGMRGFLAVMLLSTLYTCTANTGRLLLSSGMPHAFRRWLGAPALAGALAAAAGTGLRQALALPLAGAFWPRLAALGAGGCATLLFVMPIQFGQPFLCLCPLYVTLRPQELPLIVQLQCFLNGADGVDETSVAHAAVLCGDGTGLGVNKPLLLQTGHILPHGVFAQLHRLSDGAVAGMALVGSAILAAQKVIVDGNLMRAETEVEHLVWHEVVILVRISLRPTPEHQASPPVCASTHRRNSSLGTTMRLPIRSAGKPVSCMSS